MIYFLLLLSQWTWASSQPSTMHFERPCYTEDDDTLTTALRISGSQWTVTHTAFEERFCETPYLTYELQYKVRTQDQNIDMTVLEASYTPLSDVVSEALNMISFCGYADWKTKKSKVVTGDQCDEFQQPATGQVIYSIFKQQSQTGITTLFLGTASLGADGKTEEGRHQELERLPFFLR